MATGRMAEAHSHYERASSASTASKVLRTFRSRLLIGEPESRWPTDAQPMLGVRSGHALQERMDEDADSRCAARVQGPTSPR